MNEIKTHWENIYLHKQPHQVSWTQHKPEISLQLINQTPLGKNDPIIDVGGGDSRLVDFLLEEGYTNITVLDISETAILRAKRRLGELAEKVTWIVSDIREFVPKIKYALWHDRAVFHFLTEKSDIELYKSLVNEFVVGSFIIGTFSTDGPTKCSGLEISQYDEMSLTRTFESDKLKRIKCQRENHITPSGATQNFIFCIFGKNADVSFSDN